MQKLILLNLMIKKNYQMVKFSRQNFKDQLKDIHICFHIFGLDFKDLKIFTSYVFNILILKPFVMLIDSSLEFKLLCFEIH